MKTGNKHQKVMTTYYCQFPRTIIEPQKTSKNRKGDKNKLEKLENILLEMER